MRWTSRAGGRETPAVPASTGRGVKSCRRESGKALSPGLKPTGRVSRRASVTQRIHALAVHVLTRTTTARGACCSAIALRRTPSPRLQSRTLMRADELL